MRTNVPHIFAIGDIIGQPMLAHKTVHEGLTKVLLDEASERIIGCGIVGPSAGDLVAEAALAIEMGADTADIGLTIHPTPRSPRLSAWRPRCSRARSPTSSPPKRRH